MPPQSILTVDEIVSLIKHSDLPTIVVEGPSDVTIVKKWQDKFKAYVSILPTYGRPSLFEVFLRKHEFDDKRVIFLADKDMLRFSSIPTQYSEIIFTEGYCIENDIFAGSNLLGLLSTTEFQEYEKVIEVISRWFAHQLEKHRQSQPTTCDTHINEICDFNINDICDEYRSNHSYIEPRLSAVNEVMGNYKLNIRGKQLFQALSRFLNSPGRPTRYNANTLIELSVSSSGNQYLETLISKLDSQLWA